MSLPTSTRWSWLHEKTRRRSLRAVFSLAIVASVLVACADDQGGEEERRFANQPVTEQATVAEVDASPQSGPVPTAKPIPSPETLLHVRGAPTMVYANVDGQVLAVNTSNPGEETWIPSDVEASVVDLVSSPSGDRVAILEMHDDGSGLAAEVVVHGSDGGEVRRWTLPVSPRPVATPIAAGAPGAHAQGSITWSADGLSLLVAMNGDTLVSVELEGESSVLPLPANMPRITYAAWSPAGDRIGVLANDEREGGKILVFAPDDPGREAKQLVPPTADTSGKGSVIQFAWLPNGSGLAYLMANEQRGSEHGGSIYTHDERTGQRRLVATPGRGGPAAQIVDFEVSPDGKAVSYVIATPEGDAWQFNSLWIRSLKGSQALAVPVLDTLPVTDMWWVDSGLAWAQVGEGVRIDLLDGTTGTQTLVATAPPASPIPVAGATPGPSPVATPQGGGASPVAATPVLATPASSTPDVAPPAATPAPATPRS